MKVNKQVFSRSAQNKTLLTYFGFVAACVVVILGFMTATSYLQLAVAILLYPLLVVFAYKILPLRHRKLNVNPVVAEEKIPIVEESAPSPNGSNFGISDIDKRVFLKLIGGAGLLLFVFSIFNKKSESLFFKSQSVAMPEKIALEDISGNKIDPAQNQPTDGYNICEIDDNVQAFYGYTNKADGWFVMKVDNETGSFRYCRGEGNFPTYWNRRQELKYDYFSKVF